MTGYWGRVLLRGEQLRRTVSSAVQRNERHPGAQAVPGGLQCLRARGRFLWLQGFVWGRLLSGLRACAPGIVPVVMQSVRCAGQ